jgi:hypothetical protein
MKRTTRTIVTTIRPVFFAAKISAAFSEKVNNDPDSNHVYDNFLPHK